VNGKDQMKAFEGLSSSNDKRLEVEWCGNSDALKLK